MGSKIRIGHKLVEKSVVGWDLVYLETMRRKEQFYLGSDVTMLNMSSRVRCEDMIEEGVFSVNIGYKLLLVTRESDDLNCEKDTPKEHVLLACFFMELWVNFLSSLTLLQYC